MTKNCLRSEPSEVNRKPKRGKKRNASPIADEKVLPRNQKMSRLDDQISKTSKDLDDDTDDDNLLTEDEMSVNTINKNKAKLFSHILNPKNKVKSKERELGRSKKNDDNERVKPAEDVVSPKKDRNGKIQQNISPKDKKIGLQRSPNAKECFINTTSTPGKRGGRKQPQSVEFVATTDEEEDDEEEEEENGAMVANKKSKSDLSKSREGRNQIKENIRPQPEFGTEADVVRNRKSDKNLMTYNRKSRSITKGSTKEISTKDSHENDDENGESTMEDLSAPDLVTVNMDDLTDLLTSNKRSNKRSVQQQQKEEEDARQVFFARKSEPNKSLKTSQNHRSRLEKSMNQKLDLSSNNENSSGNESSNSPLASHVVNKATKNKNKASPFNPNEAASNNICHLCDRTFKIKTNLQLHLEKVLTVISLANLKMRYIFYHIKK